MKKFIIAAALILALQLVFGIAAFLNYEMEYVKTFIPPVDNISAPVSMIALSVYGKDNLLMYRKYYKRSEKLPKDYNMEQLAPLADILLQDRYQSVKKIGLERWKTFVLKYQGIDPFSLEGAALYYHTDNLMKDINLKGLKRELLRWYITDTLNKKYGKNELYRLFLDSPAYADNVYGIAAASKYFFNKEISAADIFELTYLASLISWDNSYLNPENDYQEIDRKAVNIINSLHSAGIISAKEMKNFSLKKIRLQAEVIPTIEPSYVHAVLNQAYKDDTVKKNIGEKNIDIHTGYNKKANDAVRNALKKYFSGKDEKLQAAFVLVNAHTQEAEVVIGSRRYDTQVNRAVTMSRQMASTFKPIVYLAAFTKGVKPSDQITDKPYDFSGSGYIYRPKNYNNYFMGKIPLRYGFIFSLNNATVKLAEKTGLQYIRDLSVEMGMNDNIQPFYSMALGAFPATPFNVAQIYSSILNLGERKKPSMITKIKIGDEICDMLEKPERIFSPEAAYQVLYIMEDVTYRGTARNAGFMKGTGAKTGTSNDIRDAWTVAVFGQYVAVSWVGYDDMRPIAEKGSGGALAAPIIADFQKEYFGNETIFSFQVPDNIVFKNVSKKTGLLTDNAGAGAYLEAYDKNNLPEKEN